MTTAPQVFGEVSDAAPHSMRRQTTLGGLSDRRTFAATMILLAGMYLLLENPFWVPGGDSEVYIEIAKNLATGHGLLWNGRPVGMVPPGWPLLMALVMKISPTFLALKLVTLLCMLGSLAAFYWICRRFASPSLSAGVMLLSGILSHVYSLTFWLHSDALFCLVSAGSVLLALQIGEGKWTRWRVAALLLLCAAAVFVRWAGLLNMLLVGAALLRGQWRPRLDRYWILTAAAGIVILFSFTATRTGMRLFAPPRVEYENNAFGVDAMAVMDETGGTSVGSEGFVERNYGFVTAETSGIGIYFARLGAWGTWISFLLWQPLRLGSSWLTIWHIANVIGWLVIALMLVATVRDLRALDWLLGAAVLYSFALCANWTQPTARYLVPIAPLLILGFIRGARIARQSAPHLWQRRAFHWVLLHAISAIVLINSILYGVDVWVMRGENFYDRYEAGMTKTLLATSQYLNSIHVGHGQAAVHPMYVNLGRKRLSPTGLRALTMLTGKAIRTVPEEIAKKSTTRRDRRLRSWLGNNEVVFYLEQPPISPWRVWHFRLGWLQEWKTGYPAYDSAPGWRLYQCDGKKIPLRIRTDDPFEYPRRVPGL